MARCWAAYQNRKHARSVRRVPVIPTTTPSASPPLTTGTLTFHVVVDYVKRLFSMDGPDGPNGVRLHYEVMKVSRRTKNRFWEFDIRAESQERALADMQKAFPGHKCMGTWAEAQAH
jgi:hypothetical protein